MMKVGVIGVGYLGRFHAQKYASMQDVELLYVCDISEKRGEEVAKETGSHFIKDYKEMASEVDAVSIVVPTNQHFEIAKYFLEAGVHCLVEKPITVHLFEAEALIEIAKEKGCILQVGHLERFNPAIRFLEDHVEKPLFIEAHRLSGFKERALDVDVILDLMIHDIDLTLAFVNSEIKEIRAVGVPVLSPKIDIANARIMFENGCNANLTASRISLQTMRRIRIFQPGLYLSADCLEQSNLMVTADLERPLTEAIIPRPISHERSDILMDELIHFVDCIKNGVKPKVAGEDGLKALEVAQQIKAKIQEGLGVYEECIGKKSF